MDGDARKQYADPPTESLSAPLAARLRTNALYQVRNRLDNAHGATDNFAKANHVPPELLESLRAGEDVSRHLSLFPEDVSGPLTADGPTLYFYFHFAFSLSLPLFSLSLPREQFYFICGLQLASQTCQRQI